MCDSFVIFGVLPAGLQFLETTFCSLFRSASSPQHPSFLRLNPFPRASSYRPELPLFMCRTAGTKHTMQTTNHTIHRRPANQPTRQLDDGPSRLFFCLTTAPSRHYESPWLANGRRKHPALAHTNTPSVVVRHPDHNRFRNSFTFSRQQPASTFRASTRSSSTVFPCLFST